MIPNLWNIFKKSKRKRSRLRRCLFWILWQKRGI